jgi:outer membrane protein assembly factor BamD (BamD/ComL family)
MSIILCILIAVIAKRWKGNLIAALAISLFQAWSIPIALSDTGPSAQELYKQGDAAYDVKNYAEAMRLWRQAAYVGSTDAMQRIGTRTSLAAA